MKKSTLILAILFSFYAFLGFSQNSYPLEIKIKIADSLKQSFKTNGRLFVLLSDRNSPPYRTNPGGNFNYMAKNIEDFPIEKGLILSEFTGWISTYGWGFENVPEGSYNLITIWDQDLNQAGFRNKGNFINDEPVEVQVKNATSIEVILNKVNTGPTVNENKFVREIEFRSDTLSKWWKKDVILKASILLPSNYSQGKAYPIRYNIAGYGGRYDRVNRLTSDEEFMEWWSLDDSPQLINVFLDGHGPYGDCYQMDSENSGPYGYSLINELIPYIENTYRGTNSAKTRFVDGCSTGGWVSLGLQLFYPETFNGCFSYSPDPVDFSRFQLINIYKDDNIFINEYNYEQPLRRNILGEPMWSMREMIEFENVLSPLNSYIQSGGQFGAFNALFSPKAKNGLPASIFDAQTGEIDSSIAEHWSKYDFLKYVSDNWSELGPKIENKIFISMGDMDDFYLNFATRSFDDFLKNTENPKSDAIIEFLPGVGHCQKFSHRKVIEQISKKIIEDNHS